MITLASVSGHGAGTVAVDTAGAAHPVPLEGLSVLLPGGPPARGAITFTLPSGRTLSSPSAVQPVVLFPEPTVITTEPIVDGGSALQ